MQINPINSNPAPKLPAKSLPANGADFESSNSLTNSGAAPAEGSDLLGLVGQLSIGRLVELLNTDTDLRAELVDRARVKLVTEEYLLPGAARQAADAILGLPRADQSQSPDHIG